MTVVIRNIQREDIPNIVDIANAELGYNYFATNLWELAHNKNAIFQVAEDSHHQILGFCYSYIAPYHKIYEELKTFHPIVCSPNTKSSILKTIAVKEGYKRSGIGQLFVNELIKTLQRKKVKTLYCVAWKSITDINIAGLLNKFDFKINKEIPNYWTNESLEKKYSCPVCGDNGCYCSAVIYIKTL